jgi:hypothetical protein
MPVIGAKRPVLMATQVSVGTGRVALPSLAACKKNPSSVVQASKMQAPHAVIHAQVSMCLIARKEWDVFNTLLAKVSMKLLQIPTVTQRTVEHLTHSAVQVNKMLSFPVLRVKP